MNNCFLVLIWYKYLAGLTFSINLFDYMQIRVQPPNAKGRFEILKVHARKVKLSPSVDLSSYANDLPGIAFCTLSYYIA